MSRLVTLSPCHLILYDQHKPPDDLLIGCGNLLRGDDGVGPLLIRHLWERELPAGVRLVDGGTAGMDVAFKMRGADRVILIDACSSGNEPGTLYRLPGVMVEHVAPLDGINQHAFRWDHVGLCPLAAQGRIST